jgi:hypothetical protein
VVSYPIIRVQLRSDKTSFALALGKRGLLDKLTEPPTGVEGEDLEAWHVARDILHDAPDNAAEAERLLSQVRGLPFAPQVRNWLCYGFRKVVEGYWHGGSLSKEMMGPLNQQSAQAPMADAPAEPHGNALVAAIDEALAFVEAHPDRMTRVEVDRFHQLAGPVYILAVRAGLSGSLPQVPELQPQLEAQGLSLPPVEFESKLNLPGDWDLAEAWDYGMAPPGPGGELPPVPERMFLPVATPRWLADLAALRRRAEDIDLIRDRAAVEESTTPPAPAARSAGQALPPTTPDESFQPRAHQPSGLSCPALPRPSARR